MASFSHVPWPAVPVALLVGALGAAACSSTGAASGGNPDLITRAQIEELTDENAYQIVQRLRPRWLRPRSQATFSTPGRPAPGGGTLPADAPLPEVFLDDVRFGPGESLSRISINQIEEMRFVSAVDATTRYGTGYVSGVILVRTR